MELLATLEAQRRHVQGIVEDLPEEDLHRLVLPSSWTIVGMVDHPALDVERFWFRAVIGGQRAAIDEVAPDRRRLAGRPRCARSPQTQQLPAADRARERRHHHHHHHHRRRCRAGLEPGPVGTPDCRYERFGKQANAA